MDNNKLISVLDDLIQTCKDGEQGFRTAAESLTDPTTKSSFLQFAQERAQMARELQDEVRAQGGDPERSGSVAGSAHRGWMNLKAALTSGDERIIAEAERGEDVAKKTFDEALTKGLPPTTLAVVRRHADRVHQVHDRVRAMEKAGTKH